ncbi:hypothetical protein N9E56_02905 [Flavobacteriaceae bacterium]|nr:hypothetical protein [Flavobacteriaceae bacterium]
MSCLQNNKTVEDKKVEKSTEKVSSVKQEPHNYGGWYCPDNLNGFPAVDISNWRNVVVVNGRLPTKEETQNGTSLIFVESEKFPDAKPLDMKMPKLGRFYNENSKKEELIIVIQALKIGKDSVVGFRYLNGGNGSARLDEVRFLSDAEIESLPPTRFVSHSIQINAPQNVIWEVLTKPEYFKPLEAVFDKDQTPKPNWNASSKVNFKPLNRGETTSEFAANLYGNHYIQIDSELGDSQYVEKFLLLDNEQTKSTELKIVCGPYSNTDFETQKNILNGWAQKVKELSEKK